MALTMAHSAPNLWAAVSAWVPITDLAAWHVFSKEQGSRYYRMLEACCGGAPGMEVADREYRRRSPLFHLLRAAGLPIDIQVGIRDGHNGAQVPVSHSLHAFNRLAEANGKAARCISASEIDFITRRASLPASLFSEPASESNRRHAVLFRRTAGSVRLTVFDGAHETDFLTALRWLETHASPPA